MKKPILQIGNQILYTTSETVSFPLSDEIKNIIIDIKDTLDSTGELGAGLSAVQIGKLVRVAIVRDIDLDAKLKKAKDPQKLLNLNCHGKSIEELLESHTELLESLKISDKVVLNSDLLDFYKKITEFVIINPRIILENEYETFYYEGCLSVGVGDDALYAPVARTEEITFEYFDETGEKKNLEAKNYFAHVVLHEIDHMNGKLFLSRVTDPTKIWKSKDLDVYFDKHGKYPPFV